MKPAPDAAAVTRCPHCSARFRVRAEQVKLHSGLVRCGACRGIFDAIEHLIEGTLASADPIDEHGEVTPPQTIIQGMPGMATSDAVADVDAGQPRAGAANVRATASAVASVDAAVTRSHTASSADEGVRVRNLDAAIPSEVDGAPSPTGALGDYRWREQPSHGGPLRRWGLIFLCLLSVLALTAQAAYIFRDELASRVPQLTPILTEACGYLDCRLAPPKRGDQLGFVGTDLTADPAHKGLLIFTATLRNSSATAVAYPHLILSLDGLSGELVVRRVFSPAEFAPATANLTRGLDAGAEIEIKLYLDASQTGVIGFKVDHAYL
jgi:predicted Zn finger-like uncharacterized protein